MTAKESVSRREGVQFQYVEADCYYSPNNVVKPRPLVLAPILQNPFNPGGGCAPSIRYRDLRPRPWTPSFGWTSFTPVVPCYEDGPRSILSVLRHSPPIEHFSDESGGRQGFSLIPNNAWCILEKNIYTAVCALKGAFHLPVILPFLPNVLGYTAMFTQKRYLKHSLQESREWFLVWIGALTYCLFAAQHHPDLMRQKEQHRYPFWRKSLQDAGLSDAWIDEMIYSPITDYQTIPRLGCVVDILNRPAADPEVQWFTDFGVPVWYRWGPAEEVEADKHEYIARRRPPKELELPSKQDSTAEDVTMAEAAGETDRQAAEQHQKEPEWVAFFRKQEADRPALLTRETPLQRQRRLNRMREPPTSSTPVFEWELDPQSNVDVWIRVPIPAKWRAETLMDYGEAQKRYDPFYNEWDLWTEFGEVTQEEEEAIDALVYDPLLSTLVQETPSGEPGPIQPESSAVVPTTTPPTVQTVEPPPAVPTVAPLPVVPAVEPPLAPTADEAPPMARVTDPSSLTDPSGQEIEEVFGSFYRLAPPIPGAYIPEDEGQNRRDIFLRLLGQKGALTPQGSKTLFFMSKTYPPAQHLMNCILDRQTDFAGVWDLRDDCISPVRLRARFQMLRSVGFTPVATRSSPPQGDDIFDQAEVCYVLKDLPENSVPWKLGLISASIALAVCRLPDDYTATDIARWCVHNGVPFRIFHPSSSGISPSPNSPTPQLQRSFTIPMRPFNHKFTRDDYNSYVHLRTLLLGQPHMQAALKRGGIIWRLALGTLGHSNICQTPSHLGGTRCLKLGSPELVDNALTMNELDLICGAYECVSDDGKQRALRSWWPLARYYEKEECGENYGRWSFRREEWYSTRLNHIEKDNFSTKPLTYTEWKSVQHGPRLVRTFHAVVEKASLNVLTKHVPAGDFD
ncbi:hypothetical protein FA13DRAFT_1635606 [Coprinellus micaceus]|uniref:Uncharacterized protein n=1 Tax=Coprinellus micaceus TaxID=71717 RepID=A0A4Y7SYI4_COPMI|nr:hypothetical protein FA13DRAFT_1635606 [Coprinellus micaceus]